MALLEVNNESKEAMMKKLGLNQESLDDGVRIIKEWMKLQPHLPHEFDDERLEHWIFASRNSLERAKTSLDMYYYMKNVAPEFLTGRDPAGGWFKNITNAVWHVPLKSLTEDHSRVILLGLKEDTSKYNQVDVCRLGCMLLDIRNCEEFRSSDIYIVDFANYTAGLTAKLSLSVLKKCQVVVSECFLLRIKSIHFVNVPSYVEVILGIARTVLKPKLTERIQVHSNGYDTLHEHVPKKMLPKDYGGEAASVIELSNSWNKHMESYRDFFLKEDKLKSDESKRPGKAINNGDIFGYEGSFRQLSLD